MPICSRPSYEDVRRQHIERQLKKLGGVEGAANLLEEYVSLAGSNNQINTIAVGTIGCNDYFITTGNAITLKNLGGNGSVIKLSIIDATNIPFDGPITSPVVLSSNIMMSNSPINTVANFTLPANRKIVFMIELSNGTKFFQGPAGRNPDKKVHANISSDPTGYKLEWDDGNGIFNDMRFLVTSGVTCSESNDLALLATGIPKMCPQICDIFKLTYQQAQNEVASNAKQIEDVTNTLNTANVNLKKAQADLITAKNNETSVSAELTRKNNDITKDEDLIGQITNLNSNCPK